MNNQFATQFLREDLENLPDNDLPVDIDSVVKRLMQFGLDEFEALNLAQQIVKDIKLDEDGGAAAAPAGGGGSTTGGGTTAGATFTPGAGEQYAAGTRKKKMHESDGEHKFKVGDKVKYNNQDCEIIGLLDWGYRVKGPHFTSNVIKDTIERENPAVKEDAPRLAGSPGKTTSQGAKNLSAYSSVGFTKAPSAEEAGKKMKSIDVKMLWKEGENQDWNQIQQHVMKIAKHYGYGKDYVDYMKGCYDQGLITKPADLDTCTAGWGEALREYINESRAYSQFKKQTAIRPKNEQMHEAVKMIHKKLEEVSKLVEFAKQMRNELSEGENTLEYKHNTKKIFEKINSKVVEVYTKTRDLK
jgi:hypothetical protein